MYLCFATRAQVSPKFFESSSRVRYASTPGPAAIFLIFRKKIRRFLRVCPVIPNGSSRHVDDDFAERPTPQVIEGGQDVDHGVANIYDRLQTDLVDGAYQIFQGVPATGADPMDSNVLEHRKRGQIYYQKNKSVPNGTLNGR